MASSTRPRVISSQYLVQPALQVGRVMLERVKAIKSSQGSTIAVMLHIISADLKQQPMYLLPREVEELSYEILQDLSEICTWQTPCAQSLSPKELSGNIAKLLESDAPRVTRSIAKFLDQTKNIIHPFQTRLVKLSETLMRNDSTDQSSLYQHLKPQDQNQYPEYVNKHLFDVLQEHSACLPAAHGLKVLQTNVDKWHPTRLYLDTELRVVNECVHFDIIVASLDMGLWQELSLAIPLKTKGPRGRARFEEQPASSDEQDDRPPLMEKGTVCSMLGEPLHARICLELDEACLLRKLPDLQFQRHHPLPGNGISLSRVIQSDIGVESKIKLSYAISRAFWQYYDSDLMDTRWSSEDIWFMPEDNAEPNAEPNDQIPLKAFISFPFGQYKAAPVESAPTNQFTHRFPRILSLGIVLLEIGLGKPLGLEYPSFLTHHGQTNRAHGIARKCLQDLKKVKWDDFAYKSIFEEAIAHCFDPKRFKRTERPLQKNQGRGRRNSIDHKLQINELADRKDSLYREVVAPLYWLANVGFEALAETLYITLRNPEKQNQTLLQNETILNFWDQVKTANFHSGHKIDPKGWLERLRIINAHVVYCRRAAKVTKPAVQVAILDTGYKPMAPFFQRPQRQRHIKECKDFTARPPLSGSAFDDFGHGTYMTQLVLESAPTADIYVARVAESTEDLDSNTQQISEAILHAGLKWRADIISMSFGFSKFSKVIANAILKVQSEREGSVIFLASAGNSSSCQGEAFPANLPSVISIYATNCRGAFLDTNPTASEEGLQKLGTYGDDIPTSVFEDLQDHCSEHILKPGTSVATAISAGIAATMLSYSAALPAMHQIRGTEEVFSKLFTHGGMKRLFEIMSTETGYHSRFINPIRFFADRPRDVDIFAAIYNAMSELRSQ